MPGELTTFTDVKDVIQSLNVSKLLARRRELLDAAAVAVSSVNKVDKLCDELTPWDEAWMSPAKKWYFRANAGGSAYTTIFEDKDALEQARKCVDRTIWHLPDSRVGDPELHGPAGGR